MAGIVERVEGGVDKRGDDRLDVAGSVGIERFEIARGVGQQSGRKRQDHPPSESGVAQHPLDDDTSGSAVTVGERVDRFELGMGDGDVGQTA